MSQLRLSCVLLCQSEAAVVLGGIMRDKIISRLDGMGDPESEIKTLFHEIHHDDTTSLT